MSGVGQQFNIGSDSTMTFLVNGLPLGGMLLTSLEFKQITTRKESQPVNGVPAYREIPMGWEGTLVYDRSNPLLDQFFSAMEQARYAGQLPPQITISTSITNVDGSVSRYRFNGVAAKLESGGKYSADEKVEQTVTWVASTRTALQ